MPSLVQSLFGGPLDIVGDVHGEIAALRSLLNHLGYAADGTHPDEKRLVFVGDLTDRGPDSPAATHTPALITRSPLPGGEEHYVVLNSGHTFREAELAKLNYLLFPRWGDWAVLRIASPDPASQPQELVLQAGYFDEQWAAPR